MDQFNEAYWIAIAQVIPLLLIAFGIESGILRAIRHQGGRIGSVLVFGTIVAAAAAEIGSVLALWLRPVGEAQTIVGALVLWAAITLVAVVAATAIVLSRDPQ